MQLKRVDHADARQRQLRTWEEKGVLWEQYEEPVSQDNGIVTDGSRANARSIGGLRRTGAIESHTCLSPELGRAAR